MGIIAISDLHLGYISRETGESLSNREDFIKFLDQVMNMDGINDFVICGDFLDMWRRDMAGVAIENADILEKFHMLRTKMKVHYIAGNHDFHVKDLYNFRYQFELSKKVILQEGGKTYHFKHGYDFDPLMKEFYFNALCYSNDELGDIGSRAYEVWINWQGQIKKFFASFQKTKIQADLNRLLVPAEQRIQVEEKNAINLKACKFAKDGEIIVFGHTHDPFINEKENVVNLGSWVKGAGIHNTYLKIQDGKMALKIFPNGEIKERKKC